MSHKVTNWLLFAAISVIWGSSFILMKAGMTALSAYQVAALRMFSGGLVLLPLAVQKLGGVPREKMGLIILSGFIGSFFPAFLFCIAETRIDSSLAGILNALTPVFTILIGAVFFNIRVSPKKILGVVIGFTGLSLLFLSKGNISWKDFSYASLVLIATICYGLNVNLVSRYLTGVGAVTIASFAFAFLLLPSAAVLTYTGFFSLDLAATPVLKATGAAILLGVLGTALASIFFYMLVKKAGTLFSSLVTYGIPFVAIGWGLIFGESINSLQVVCLGIILVGVFIVSRKQ
ncbi:DMT family transporter [Flavihumibacter fluvii]|uniref:DMT family transporter n=1 Tax=Flavihumibacter fluvii TaxID=2838157 RepID=UPI001BDF5DAE|nr:DMT family transporter [Flavihumibacter fluvii]ULQ51144.1 DMT family transporter [Flavihumibacter fluvii]